MIPLIFFSLTSSISSLQENKQSSFLWKGTLIFYFSTMVFAVLLMMLVMNIFQPGTHSDIQNITNPLVTEFNQQPYLFMDGIKSIIKNPFEALASGNIMAIVVFSILFGLALRSDQAPVKKVKNWFDGMFDITMIIVNKLMDLAPVGIFALLSLLIIQQDLTVFLSLAYFILLVLGVIFFHGVVFLPLILRIFTQIGILKFFSKSKTILITAFATSSSAATLPISISNLENNFKVDQKVSRFVLPLGATVNMDGTALYEAAVALFVANIVGIDLGLSDQIFLVFLAMAASIGAPAIPSAGMVTLALVLGALNLPVEYIALFLPIDRLIDTFRTTVNVEGDLVGALVMNKFFKA
jgi:Na+/H+-dicarboxylate symporter